VYDVSEDSKKISIIFDDDSKIEANVDFIAERIRFELVLYYSACYDHVVGYILREQDIHRTKDWTKLMTLVIVL
jgi:hypothetical protein